MAVKDEAGNPPPREEEEDGEMEEEAVAEVEVGKAMQLRVCVHVDNAIGRKGGAALGVDDIDLTLLSGKATV